jgi:hypothetical protein
MKPHQVLYVLFLFIVNTANSQYKWEEISLPMEGTYSDILFIDELHGVITGNTSNSEGFLLNTVDKGESWNEISFKSSFTKFFDIDFIDETTGFVSTWNKDSSFILKTFLVKGTVSTGWDTGNYLVPVFNISFHEMLSDHTIISKKTVSICPNENILLNTLCSVTPPGGFSISWYVKSSGGQENPISNNITPNSDTIVYFRVEEENGCSIKDSIQIFMKTGCETGIINSIFDKAVIFFYPNPNTGEFVLSMKYIPSGSYSLRIYNVLNQEVLIKDFETFGSTTQYIILKKAPGYYLGVIYFNNKAIRQIPIVIN